MMKRKPSNRGTNCNAAGGWKSPVAVGGISAAVLGMTSCNTTDLSGVGDALNQGLSHAGGFTSIPSEARQVVRAIRTLEAIAEYQASEEQLASARSKAKSTPAASTERQYIRVKPDPEVTKSKKSAAKGTHVVAYNPSTDKLDDEVVVVPETDLSRGDSVSINGQSGKII